LGPDVAVPGQGNPPRWDNHPHALPAVFGLAPAHQFGVFGTTWYYKLDLPGVADFVKRYQAAYPDTSMRVPGNVFYNGYMATRELLRAIERVGNTNNIAIIKQLEGLKMSAEDRMQNHEAWIDPNTHQVQQTIYLATANAGTEDPDNMFKILNASPPEDVLDTEAEAACKLESYDATPTFDA
jgi:branched-chain amino acid transport system substrate-binding protein